MLLFKATYNWGTHQAIHLKKANRQEVLVIPSFKHWSNKYKLDRERLKKREKKKDEVLKKSYILMTKPNSGVPKKNKTTLKIWNLKTIIFKNPGLFV